MKRLLLLPALLLLAWLLTGLVRVGPEERAVVRRFGRVVAHPGPGLWIGLPWGIDRVDRMAVRSVRQLAIGYDPERDATGDTPAGQFLTGDQNLVNARVVLDYVIVDTDAGLDRFSMERERIDGLLAREAESLVAEWIAGHSVDDVLLAGRADLPRWLAARLPGRLAPLQCGVELQRASVDSLAAPSEVRTAFEAVNQAQSAIHTREMLARKDADQRRQQAQTLKFDWQQQADAYRSGSLSAARAEAAAFGQRLDQYRRAKASNPDALAALWWDEIGLTLRGLRARGRIDLLDQHLGKDGLDITQFLPPKGKP